MSEVPKKPTWVEMLESSIEELKKEYDERFKELEERLFINFAMVELDLLCSVFLLFPNKTEENFDHFLDGLKRRLDAKKEIGVAIFKKDKILDTVVTIAKNHYNIGSFENLVKKLSGRFTMSLIKESMTIETVTQHYGVEGASIFKTL